MKFLGLNISLAKNEATQSETQKKRAGKRLPPFDRRRMLMAIMQQDVLKQAVLWAKDPVRPRRDLLYPLYEEVWDNDGHTIGETRKSILKVVGSPFAVFPYGSEEVDEVATRLLQRKWFEDYRKYFQETNFWGHSLVQFREKRKCAVAGLEYEFSKVELVEREHVRPEEGYIVVDTSQEIGLNFRDDSIRKTFMLFEMGHPKYLGLLRLACKEYIWKNFGRSDWSRHAEKFGTPILNIKTDTTDDNELKRLAEMADNFGHNLWFIGDESDSIEIVETTFKDSYQIYKELALFSNDEISKAISGGTGTSQEKAFVGSADVHERILNEFVEANKRAETYHINEELFPFLDEQGYPVEGKEFRYLDYQEANPDDPDDEEVEDQGNKNPKGSGGSRQKKSQPRRGAKGSPEGLLK